MENGDVKLLNICAPNLSQDSLPLPLETHPMPPPRSLIVRASRPLQNLARSPNQNNASFHLRTSVDNCCDVMASVPCQLQNPHVTSCLLFGCCFLLSFLPWSDLHLRLRLRLCLCEACWVLVLVLRKGALNAAVYNLFWSLQNVFSKNAYTFQVARSGCIAAFLGTSLVLFCSWMCLCTVSFVLFKLLALLLLSYSIWHSTSPKNLKICLLSYHS